MGCGSPLCAGLGERIICQFKNVSQPKIAKYLGKSPSTVNNILKRFRELGEIYLCKDQGQKLLLNVHDLRWYCIRNCYASMISIVTWAWKCFGKLLLLNTFTTASNAPWNCIMQRGSHTSVLCRNVNLNHVCSFHAFRFTQWSFQNCMTMCIC